MKGMKWAVLYAVLVLANAGMSSTAAFAADSPTPVVTPDTQNVPVTEVEVKAQKEKVQKPKEGSAEAGYKVDNTTTTGPWGEMKLQDTPYSISVIPQELIENVVTGSREQLFRMSPLLQTFTGDNRAGANSAFLRGFPENNQFEDGIRASDYNIYTEDKERVEIFTGSMGFLYGPDNVGGTINYVLKRPTQERINNITIGDYGGTQMYAHGDFGGPIDKNGKFGYRLNFVTEKGDTEVDDQKTQRYLVSGALDFHITHDALLQIDASYVNSQGDGVTAFWGFNGVNHYVTPDAGKDWGQPYSHFGNETYRAGAKFTWDINKSLSFRAGYKFQELYSNQFLATLNFPQANGTLNQTIYEVAPYTVMAAGEYMLLDVKFATGPVQHKVTMGFTGDYLREDDPPDIFASKAVTGLSLSQPTVVPEPSLVTGTKPLTISYSTEHQNWTIGDNVTINDQWSLLFGMNYARIIGRNYDITSGALTADYDKNAITPSASLVYKPVPWLSTYFTYIEALEQGAIVPTTGGYTNAGQLFSPLITHQYEAGAKATLGSTLLTLALFQIDKANQYAVTNSGGTLTYVQDGREVHKGIEFTTSGKVVEGLTLFGGLTLMNCEITNEADNPALNGKRPGNVVNQMFKLYTEYDLPWVHGLTLTGGAYYTGSFYADANNTDKLPGVITGDIGARYVTKINNGTITQT